MTTYRSIASTETDPDAPITSALMKALQNNLLAIREGDSTAPKIQNAAFADNTIHGLKILDTTIFGYKLVSDANMRYPVGYGMAANVANDVGTFGFFRLAANATINPSGYYAGSDLRWSGFAAGSNLGDNVFASGTGGTPSGTWMAMGYCPVFSTARAVSLFLRVS